ncbi:MAG: enterochelin esterase [Clostridia bacterium]|nr:enterochelin esterase [Clostridia bacterium]
MYTNWPLDTAVSFDPYFGEPGRDGDQGWEILPDGKVRFHIKAPDAREVAIDQFGHVTPLTRVSDEMWEGEVDLGRGFKYFFLKVDGCDVLNPYLPIGYGCCRPMNFVDVPVPGEDWNQLRNDVPHGSVARHYYFSTVTGKTESCLVYLPATYDAQKRYPVLYLQHGYGENETGWVYQGHLARIADNLLSEGRMEEMIIVMGCGMAQPQSGASREMGRMLFPQVLLTDLIPYIESRFPVLTDKWHRAMAGLSMGSYQTSIVTLSNPDLFGYAGVFSGFLSFRHRGNVEEKHLALLEDAAKFNESFRVFYRAMGTEDNFFQSFVDDDAMLQDKGLNMERQLFPGGHDWSVWRRCIYNFLPKLFK